MENYIPKLFSACKSANVCTFGFNLLTFENVSCTNDSQVNANDFECSAGANKFAISQQLPAVAELSSTTLTNS